MAIFFEDTSMVFWRIHMNGNDITDLLGKFVKSMSIKDEVAQGTSKNPASIPASSTATITISSNNYIEDIFVEGTKIEIYMGHDRLNNPLVFRGTIKTLPDGSASEMLHYTVKAFGSGFDMAMDKKNRTFINTIKAYIVHQVVAEAGFALVMDVDDTEIISARHAPIQKNQTDLEFLNKLAHDWRCMFWFEAGRFVDTMYFVDASKSHAYGDRKAKVVQTSDVTKGKIYDLGYRTDYAKSNIAKFEWKKKTARGGSATNAGVLGFRESGKVDGPNEYRILAKGQTYKLRPQYLKEALTQPWKFGKYTALVTWATIKLDAYTALNKYYVVEKYTDSTSRDIVPPHGESGFDITVTLNIGDPYLKPPRNAYLWHGVLNDNADSALLPNWLFRNTPYPGGPAQLKINSTELKYMNGRLISVLKCSMGDVDA